MKVALIGEYLAGKTTLWKRLLGYNEPDYPSEEPRGLVERTALWNSGDQQLSLRLIDLPGQHLPLQRSLPSYWTLHGFVLVYDITDRDSFDIVPSIVDEARDNCPDASLVLVGNKVDLAEQRQVSWEEGKDRAESLGMPFLETSGTTNFNVTQAMHALLAVLRPQQSSALYGFEVRR